MPWMFIDQKVPNDFLLPEFNDHGETLHTEARNACIISTNSGKPCARDKKFKLIWKHVSVNRNTKICTLTKVDDCVDDEKITVHMIVTVISRLYFSRNAFTKVSLTI